MGRSPGLALYLLATSWPGQGALPKALRPDGPLVWLHVGHGVRLRPAIELGRRIGQSLDGTNVLVTAEAGGLDAAGSGVISAPAPEPRSRAVRSFLEAWTPDVAILTGTEPHAAYVAEASDRGIPLIWAEARVAETGRRLLRLLPGASAELADHYTAILAASPEDTAAIARLCTKPSKVETLGEIRDDAVPLACNEGDRDALAALLAARPVWLASHLPLEELGAVETAHTEAQRLSHRLLLIVAPAKAEDGAAMQVMLEAEGWRTALRSEGTEPEPEVQVYIADTSGELGLWYRLAPVTFVGGTLSGKARAGDPYEGAALGSAILHGPEKGPHDEAFSLLRIAGAARQVVDGNALGDAVAGLLAPDRAAEMARRAWDVVSSGAPVTDRIIELVTEALDRADRR